jgi:hypothetical protein
MSAGVLARRVYSRRYPLPVVFLHQKRAPYTTRMVLDVELYGTSRRRIHGYRHFTTARGQWRCRMAILVPH